MTRESTTVFKVAAVRDAAGTISRPGIVVVRSGMIVAAGHPQEIDAALMDEAQIVEMPDTLVLPALVNAHAHLQLTPIGPVPMGGGFVAWLNALMRRFSERVASQGSLENAVSSGVELGAAQSIEQGVGFVGDIASHAVGAAAMERAGLSGVSYLELTGIGGVTLSESLQSLAQRKREIEFSIRPQQPRPGAALVRPGLSPHAPYSTGMPLYQAVAQLGHQLDLPLSTHIAETTEEIEFVARAAGPLRELLVSLGKWEPAYSQMYGRDQHPIAWVSPVLEHLSGFRDNRKFKGQFRNRWLLAHCNYVADEQIEILASTGSSVVYCPIASDYFGHPRAGFDASGKPRISGHRYRAMMEAMVNVCLGTDSILCQPASEPQPLSVLQQMRYLYKRDATEPALLLQMGTTNGLRALGFDERLATLSPDVPANLIGVTIDPNDATDPLTQALRSDTPVRRIVAPA
jgi:aminodeoxyfutalosine deaminase